MHSALFSVFTIISAAVAAPSTNIGQNVLKTTQSGEKGNCVVWLQYDDTPKECAQKGFSNSDCDDKSGLCFCCKVDDENSIDDGLQGPQITAATSSNIDQSFLRSRPSGVCYNYTCIPWYLQHGLPEECAERGLTDVRCNGGEDSCSCCGFKYSECNYTAVDALQTNAAVDPNNSQPESQQIELPILTDRPEPLCQVYNCTNTEDGPPIKECPCEGLCLYFDCEEPPKYPCQCADSGALASFDVGFDN